jgi:pyruvate dehydrogenase E1 component alpha subunit
VHEALNFAGVWQAPVVFICVNNQWAISTGRGAQTRSETIAQKAIAYGFDGIQVDGNDALAVYKATSEALQRAKSGGGPTLIEALTFRLMMHTTADDPKRYRGEGEVESWWKRDPLTRLEIYLRGRGLWDDERAAALRKRTKARIDETIRELEADYPVAPDAPFDHVYGTKHPYLEAQRQKLLQRHQRQEAAPVARQGVNG